MEKEEVIQARKFFDNRFATLQSTLRGTEEEVVVYKIMAWRWYLIGRASMIEQARQQAIKNLDTVNEMQRQIEHL